MMKSNQTVTSIESESLNLVQSFVQSLSLLEQAHRRLHDVVKYDLERGGERHLTGVQALLLYEIGKSEKLASVLRSRGAFAGTSLSYNMKKLQEGGYLLLSRSHKDKRTVRLKLTERGLKVHKRVENLFDRQAIALEPTASVRPDDLDQLKQTISRLERFWTDQIRFQL